MANPYIYSVSADMPGGAVNEEKLHAEIVASAIATTLNNVRADMDVLTITFTGDLSAGDKTILDGDTTGPAGGLLATHDNTATSTEMPSVQASSNANLTTNTGVTHTLAFQAEDWDTHGSHDNVINNERLTILTSGKYIVDLSLVWASNATGDRTASIRLNGSTFIAQDRRPAANNGGVMNVLSKIYDFVAGDYVEAQVVQDSGGDLLINGTISNSMKFSAVWIGP